MSAVCQERGPKPGDVIGALCACGHVNVVHDAGGCAVCALRVIAPASDPQPPTLRGQVARAMHDAYEARAAERIYVRALVAYVYSGDPRFGGIEPGHVVLGLADIEVSRPLRRTS